MARLRALARRREVERPSMLEVGSLRIDPASRRVWRGEEEVEVTSKGFAILEIFMRQPDVILSRFDLLEGAGRTVMRIAPT